MAGHTDTFRSCKLMSVAYENLPTTTYSSPHAFPSSLRSKRALVQNTTTEEQAAKSKDTIVRLPPYSDIYLDEEWLTPCRVTKAVRNAENRD
jgi:hypothetical protein